MILVQTLAKPLQKKFKMYAINTANMHSMNINIEYIEDPLYTKMYYLYLYRKIKLGFYQSRGFVISPEAKLKNAAEVMFPRTKWLQEKADYIDTIATHLDNLFLHRFFALPDETRDIDLVGIDLPIQGCNTKMKTEISNKINDPIMIEFLDFLQISTNIKISVIPVSIGTSCTYTSKVEDETLCIYSTLRVDLPYNHLIHSIVGAVVLFSSREFEKNTDETQRSKSYWLKRQYLVDFLNNHTKLSQLKTREQHGKFGSGTLRDIAGLEQLGEYYEKSTNYLKELGVTPHLNIALKKKQSN